jgi:hypothetical protein
LTVEEDSDERRGRMVGPLTEEERLKRVQRYLQKKHRKTDMKKYSYVCRKQVAEKRLRIKGRFVTKEQAFQILGLSQEELLDNTQIQSLLTELAEDPVRLNSVIQNTLDGSTIKIANFQALIDDRYSHKGVSSVAQTRNDISQGDKVQDSQLMSKQLNLMMNSSNN